jgi:glycosyltransferase involved in cell wall biosynthesis
VRRIQLSIVIPAHNEEVTVAGVVRGHRETARALASSFELIVCDDGSTDGTWAELQRSCAEIAELRLLRNPSRLGIPPTMKRLYAEAQGEWIYFTPADGQVPAAAFEPMWSIREGAALVVGRRVPRRDPASRVVIAQLYSGLLRRIFRLPVHDIDSVKLYRAEDLRSVPPRSASNFFEAEILITLFTRGRVVREIDIPHRPRIAGIAEGVTPAGALLAMRDVAAFTIRWLLRRDR